MDTDSRGTTRGYHWDVLADRLEAIATTTFSPALQEDLPDAVFNEICRELRRRIVKLLNEKQD